jgi:hypothetical protein
MAGHWDRRPEETKSGYSAGEYEYLMQIEESMALTILSILYIDNMGRQQYQNQGWFF